MSTWSVEQAKNRFSAVVAAAERGEAQLVTKRGRPVAYVVRAEDYDALTGKPDNAVSFVQHLLTAPKAPPGIDVDALFSRAEWGLRDSDASG